MSQEQIDVRTRHGLLDSWVFYPEQIGTWPAVILHTDIRGVRPTFIEMGGIIAERGYFVILPNLYYRKARTPVVDPGKSLRDDATRAYLTELKNSLTPEGLRDDHRALLAYLDHDPLVSGDKVGIIGYCMSGAIALHAAADFPNQVAAAASFHGGRLATDSADSPHLRASKLRSARLYFGYAKNDASMSDEMIAILEKSLTSAGVDFSAEQYSASHGFAVKDSPSYDKAAAEQHWHNIFRLLESTLKVTA
jgi:carboxymethylenebutenolidase